MITHLLHRYEHVSRTFFSRPFGTLYYVMRRPTLLTTFLLKKSYSDIYIIVFGITMGGMLHWLILCKPGNAPEFTLVWSEFGSDTPLLRVNFVCMPVERFSAPLVYYIIFLTSVDDPHFLGRMESICESKWDFFMSFIVRTSFHVVKSCKQLSKGSAALDFFLKSVEVLATMPKNPSVSHL